MTNNPTYANTPLGSHQWLTLGFDGSYVSRTLFYFGLAGLSTGPQVQVLSSNLRLYNWYSVGCTQARVNVQGLGSPPSIADTTTWNTQPPLDATSGPYPSVPFVHGAAGCPANWQDIDTTSTARRWLTDGIVNAGMTLRAQNESDLAQFRGFYAAEESGGIYAPTLTITYNRLPTMATPKAPADQARFTNSAGIRLEANTATDPDGDQVYYWFRGTTDPDAETGHAAIQSGWITTPYFDVPGDALQDGATYYWHVFTWDYVGFGAWTLPNWQRAVTLDLHLGEQAADPYDEVGPVKVNLSSGNLTVSTSSPEFPTVGGQVGLSYNYNSKVRPQSGLKASYFNDANGNKEFDDPLVLGRIDPNVTFEWGSGGPGGAVSPDNFLARWEGFLTAPVTGTYKLFSSYDDSMRARVGGTMVLDRWSDQQNVVGVYSSPFSLTAGTAVVIQAEYSEGSGQANVHLWIEGPFGPNGATKLAPIPASWLVSDSPVIAAAWSLDPANLSYSSVRIGENTASLTDISGAPTIYLGKGPGYAPPAQDDGVLALDATGAATLHADDGYTYGFDRYGQVSSATTATDDGSQASPTFQWSSLAGKPSRLARITDPAGERSIVLRYKDLDPALACPAPGAGFSAPPVYSLCQVDYWDGTKTQIWYSSGQLSRVEDPGGEVTDFVYADGRLTQIRSPLAADAVAAGSVGYDDAAGTARTVIDYDSSGRVASVTLPASSPGAARPKHSYRYGSGETFVDAAGISPSSGFFRKDTLDSLGRMATDTDATAATTSFAWDAGDRLTSRTDPAGRKTTTIYDGDAPRVHLTGIATANYGPANGSCFSGLVPNGSCTSPAVAKTTADHDLSDSGTPVNGLAATFWANPNLQGTAASHAEQDPAAGSGSLVPASPLAEPWSGRYAGEINLSTTGSYGFSLNLTGRARLFVDDALVVNAWSDPGTSRAVSGTFSNTAAGRHRFRIDYAKGSSAAQLELRWTPPGQAQSPVPAGALAPRYANPVKTTVFDSTTGERTTLASYETLATGLIKKVTEDPTGLNLETQNGYEAPGAGKFMRRISKTLPAGNAWSYAYYGAGASRDNPCPATGSANQGGALRTATGPDPDGAGPQTSRVQEYVYDAAGRTAASRIGGEAWTCTTYDSRGRIKTRTIPANATQAARTVTYEWAVGADPLVTSVSDSAGTITTTLDLLERVVSYKDVWDKTTSYTYDQVGRLVRTDGPQGRVDASYDDAGRTKTQSLGEAGSLLAGPVVADAAYNSSTKGLESVSYPTVLLGVGGNGTKLSAIGRDSAGRTTKLTWQKADGSAIAEDQVSYSQSGKVVDQTIDGSDPRARQLRLRQGGKADPGLGTGARDLL
ncbi:hypothetical protein BH23ACT12_BH23ACT12_02680 [soil metagenome]